VHDTRRRILEVLRRDGPQTVGELAHALCLTRHAVVSQLAMLQADGLAARSGLRPGPRRPRVVYALTPGGDACFPKRYDELASALLEALKQRDPAAVHPLCQQIAERWTARDHPRVEGLHGDARVARVVEILSEYGFMPAAERTAGGIVIRERNCPFIALTSAHPEVCEIVYTWVEGLLGTSCARERWRHPGDPFSMCAFRSQAGAAPA
jgi:predicted ArsR family transcriptional regulator